MVSARKPPAAGKGRPKGATNKLTRAFKEAVLNVYNGLGGDPAMLEWARKNPTEFYKIAARLIPHEVVGSGKDGEHVLKIIHEQIKAG
jgi:hypothetical protein